MTAPTNQALAVVRVGGRTYPAQSNHRCATCVHPDRVAIERRLVRGDAPSAIVGDLASEAPLTARQLVHHLRAHLPLTEEAVAQVQQDAAEARGEVVAEGGAQIAAAIRFAQRIVRAADARLAAGEEKAGLRDGLHAARLLADLDARASEEFDRDDVAMGFLCYMRALRATCSPEQVRVVTDAIGRDPVMRSLLARSTSDA